MCHKILSFSRTYRLARTGGDQPPASGFAGWTQADKAAGSLARGVGRLESDWGDLYIQSVVSILEIHCLLQEIFDSLIAPSGGDSSFQRHHF